MDLTATAAAVDPVTAAATSLPAGIDHAALENDGPKAFGDKLGTPAPDETVLWKGRPDTGLLARTAFHARKAGLYMGALMATALVLDRPQAAIVVAVLGTILCALLYLLAWASARSTLYILTDSRLIMRIGVAIETRVNIPLKQIDAASLALHGKDGHGDIALAVAGERLLGTLLLWPHVRPWHYAMPQPMLRAVPDAAGLARMIAEQRAQFGSIAVNLTENKEPVRASEQTVELPVALPGRPARVIRRGPPGLEGAPA